MVDLRDGGARTARRRSGRRRRATSRSTGRACAGPRGQRQGGRAHHRRRAKHVAQRLASCTSGIMVALDGAARRDRELRRGDRQLPAALLLAERARAARRAGADPGRPQRAAACHHRGRRRRVRAEDRSLSGIPRDPGGGAQDSAGRCTGCRTARRPSSATTMRATPISDVELALDENGKFLALRIRHLGNMGAYIGAVGANIQTVNLTRCLPGMYDIRLIDVGDALRLHQHHRHRRPIAAPGGRRRTTSSSASIDEAARVTGIDPVKLRRRNLIKPQGDAVQDRGRHHLSTAATSRRCSTRRWRSPTTTASSSAGARRQARHASAASASPACWSMPAASPIEGTDGELPRRRDARCSASTCSRPARATPPIFNPMLAERLGIDPSRSSTATATRAWRSPAMPRSARARR